MSDLLATKLYRPSIPPKRVQRARLIQQLNEGLELGRQITLVSAPAGFGKTTCVSEWVKASGLPVAWLSLDPADDDPGRFFAYLIAALQKVDASLGREIEGILRAGQLPPHEVLSASLINELQALDGRFLLVLDDFQVIQDGFILQVLEKLVTHLPQSLHLVLVTREDPCLPLAKLRANNQLVEIRAGDLRFTNREADDFLNAVMALRLSPEDRSVLEERTEGWIVGLQLAGLSVRDRADPSGFIAGLSGSHRYILSYLVEEVLSRQPQEIQSFLLQTSVLERMCAPLCEALLKDEGGRMKDEGGSSKDEGGRMKDEDGEVAFSPSPSAFLLERLERANLFVIPLDDEGRWYRYHHLFGDLLRDLLSTRHKERVGELHRRASRWYAQAGMVSEAIQHALAAADYAAAVHLIESHAMDMLMQWHVKTVEGWMRAIPAEWCAQSPQANLAFAWMHFLRGNPAGAFPYLERLQGMFPASQAGEEADRSLEAKWLALQSMLLNAQGKAQESLAVDNQALEIAPREDVHVRSLIYLGLAGAYQQLDDYPHAVEAFQEIIRHGRAATNSVAEMLGISGLALLAIQHGQLHLAFEIVSEGVEKMEHSGALPPISTALYGELGEIHYKWHQLEPAHRYFRRAIQVSALSGYSDAELYYGVILSRLFQIEGDLEAAAGEIHKAASLMQVEAPAAVREEVISQQVRIYLAQKRPAAAEALLQGRGFSFQGEFTYPELKPGRIIALSSRESLSAPLGLLYLCALRILLYRVRAGQEMASLNAGIGLASSLVEEALRRQYLPFGLEALLLRAQMHALLGNAEARRGDVAKALELAEPEGLISVFVEEGAEIQELISDYRAEISSSRSRARRGGEERLAGLHGARPSGFSGLPPGFERRPIRPRPTRRAAPSHRATDRPRAGRAALDGTGAEIRRNCRKIVHLREHGALARQGAVRQAGRGQPHQSHRGGPATAHLVDRRRNHIFFRRRSHFYVICAGSGLGKIGA